MNGRRVVITGLGAVTPSGIGVPELWNAVVHGRSAITQLEGPGFDGLAVRIGGQVRGFDVSTVLDRSLAKRLSPVQHWAIAAADEALAQAGVDAAATGGGAGAAAAAGGGSGAVGALPWDAERVAVIAATGSGPIDAMQSATRVLDERGPRAVPLTLSIHGAPDSAAALLSQRYGIRGPAQGVSATCASGAVGLGDGLRRIRHGYADAVLVVGMEDCLNGVNLSSNANMRALAAGYEGAPETASRPFDRSRSGFVMSQGAAAILIESEEHALARGADVLAVLAGFGSASDAHHPTAPHPEGRGAAQAVRECLADAGVGPEAVDHINAHGTGTPAGDAAELLALEAALGEHARRTPISATKSSTGHLLGAGGVVEAIISVMSLRQRLLPPTLNLDDPEFDGWDFVAGNARSAAVSRVLSTSFGFGGHNGAVLIERP
ncbi:beta-ketoacyl-[acyl-carrier-protein] synthase family protein [Leucobacter aridicollis]|uniref:3-oxoacyl-[acyl-carrier-protein] synthase II n=1 Tax=Leucobacter aridicollis TaxID=283878 RepID=A0A852RBI3_9MICO|nr:beta-ketoacyl-[acyl-carrier-protein] synthase family protein [Leucobacter aridicollis]MBL3682318.1 beta-ketoacyl-[acyl-carrier-protein] synthase family protein [Leucobacter aridicollis]NYD25734.1 3-oxoacyl-[acyl-carrier-protein] synthase II [Leucobacter aridicollis]